MCQCLRAAFERFVMMTRIKNQTDLTITLIKNAVFTFFCRFHTQCGSASFKGILTNKWKLNIAPSSGCCLQV